MVHDNPRHMSISRQIKQYVKIKREKNGKLDMLSNSSQIDIYNNIA